MRMENLRTSISQMSYEEAENLILEIRKLRISSPKKKASKRETTINLSDIMTPKKRSNKKPNLKTLMQRMSKEEKAEILKMFKGEE